MDQAMPIATDTSIFLSRRRVLTGAAGGIAGLSLGDWSLVAEQSPHLDDLVVEKIRAGYPAPSGPLSLLLPHGSGANLSPVVTAFSQRTGIELRLVEVSVDEVVSEMILDNVLGRKIFDVALPATFALPDLAAAGMLLSLDRYNAHHEPPGFRDGNLYHVGDTFDGTAYGFQTDGDAYMMFYHRDMLLEGDTQSRYADRYGKPLQIPDTWEELDRQMAFFHAPDDGVFGGLLFRVPQYLAWEWWVRLHAKGVWPLSPDLTPQIDGEAGVRALEEMIRATEHLVPAVDTLGLFQNWARYEKGDVFANIGWGGTQKYLNRPKSNMRGRMLFAPTPGGAATDGLQATPYFNWGWSYVVSATSQMPELAYLFSLFASSPRMSTLAVRQPDGFFDPYRVEHYQDTGVVDAYSEPFLKVHKQVMSAAIPDFYLKGQSEYFSTLASGLDDALHGGVDPEKALRRVAQSWDLITSRAGRHQQIERWARLRGKYPSHIRAGLRDLAR
ncbi:MAG: multiple sugar transport system substrate-binding protein [Sulfitobacter sp.]